MKKLLVALGLFMAFSAPTFATTNDGDRQIPGPTTGEKTYPYRLEVWSVIKGRDGMNELKFVLAESGKATISTINDRTSTLMRMYPYPRYEVYNSVPVIMEPPIFLEPWEPPVLVPWNPDGPIVVQPWDPDRPIRLTPKG